jgi:hypothetical protein
MTKEERYELLDYMEQSQTLHGDLTAKSYIREMWLDLGDCMNDIEEAIYKMIEVVANK